MLGADLRALSLLATLPFYHSPTTLRIPVRVGDWPQLSNTTGFHQLRDSANSGDRKRSSRLQRITSNRLCSLYHRNRTAEPCTSSKSKTYDDHHNPYRRNPSTTKSNRSDGACRPYRPLRPWRLRHPRKCQFRIGRRRTLQPT
jgi:hypothetical protein